VRAILYCHISYVGNLKINQKLIKTKMKMKQTLHYKHHSGQFIKMIEWKA